MASHDVAGGGGRLPSGGPPAWHLFVPKLVTTLRQGYGIERFSADLFAGLTVAIVALPLAMALAIASGTTPDKGLITAVVAGFLISALGGSRFQIGRPDRARSWWWFRRHCRATAMTGSCSPRCMAGVDADRRRASPASATWIKTFPNRW